VFMPEGACNMGRLENRVRGEGWNLRGNLYCGVDALGCALVFDNRKKWCFSCILYVGKEGILIWDSGCNFRGFLCLRQSGDGSGNVRWGWWMGI
jgi:hypothetical protein